MELSAANSFSKKTWKALVQHNGWHLSGCIFSQALLQTQLLEIYLFLAHKLQHNKTFTLSSFKNGIIFQLGMLCMHSCIPDFKFKKTDNAVKQQFLWNSSLHLREQTLLLWLARKCYSIWLENQVKTNVHETGTTTTLLSKTQTTFATLSMLFRYTFSKIAFTYLQYAMCCRFSWEFRIAFAEERLLATAGYSPQLTACGKQHFCHTDGFAFVNNKTRPCYI